MTALALSSSTFHRVSLNWPRVSAYSGSLSFHIGLLLLLLLPPVAMEIRHSAETPPMVVTILPTPRPIEQEPELPKPIPIKRTLAVSHPRPEISITKPIEVPAPGPVAPPVETPANPADTGQHAAADDHAGGGVADSAPTALAYLSQTRVPYPIEPLRRHEQGTVVLRVLVGADGNPQQIEIEKSSGSHALDNAAKAAVGHWRFKPGMRGGIAFAAWARVPIAFSLPE